MNTSENKIINKPATDPFDKLIFEQKVRIKSLFFEQELDIFLVVLTNGKVLNLKISDFAGLKNADITQLNHWELLGGGTAVSWEALNEDLSVKGFLKQAALNEVIYHFASVA